MQARHIRNHLHNHHRRPAQATRTALNPDTTTTPPLGDADLARLEHLLASLEHPLQPLELSALDGYLCGVLLQPRPAALAQWWPFVVDVEGRPAADSPALRELQPLVLRRHAELNQAIEQRQWFDPWIFAGEAEEEEEEEEEDDSGNAGASDRPPAVQTVLPWVAGFAAAMEHFPQLMDSSHPDLVEPLALLFMHFNPEDLEDADALLAMIETLEPPSDLAEAVQDIVRALMLVADVTRPRQPKSVQRPATRPATRRPGAAKSGAPTRTTRSRR